MTVTEAQYGAATAGLTGTAWVRLSGTIGEVLQELADKSINRGRVVWYLDGGTNATALYCKQQ